MKSAVLIQERHVVNALGIQPSIHFPSFPYYCFKHKSPSSPPPASLKFCVSEALED